MSSDKDINEIIGHLIDRIASLEGRHERMIRHGPVTDVDTTKQRYRIQIGGTTEAPVKGPWIPYGGQHNGAIKEHIPPTVGEQHTQFSPDGDYEQAVGFPSTFSTKNPSPSTDADAAVRTMGAYTRTLKADRHEMLVGTGESVALHRVQQKGTDALHLAGVDKRQNFKIRIGPPSEKKWFTLLASALEPTEPPPD